MNKMKNFFLFLMSVSLFATTACSSDDNNSDTTPQSEIELSYTLNIGLYTSIEKIVTGDPAPSIAFLANYTLDLSKDVAKQVLKDDMSFKIKGKGKDQDEAIKDADRQAIEKFNKYNTAVVKEEILKREALFKKERSNLADKILAEPKNFIFGYTMGLDLSRKTIGVLGIETLKVGEKFGDFKAQGGVDYSK